MSEKCIVCGMDIMVHGVTCVAGGAVTEHPRPTKAEILAAIESEPELPGAMPQEMFEVIREDRSAMAETLRIAVRQTKAGILHRVANLYPPDAA